MENIPFESIRQIVRIASNLMMVLYVERGEMVIEQVKFDAELMADFISQLQHTNPGIVVRNEAA